MGLDAFQRVLQVGFGLALLILSVHTYTNTHSHIHIHIWISFSALFPWLHAYIYISTCVVALAHWQNNTSENC